MNSAVIRWSCAALAALAFAPQAWACGACVEDKVAATYDHAVVQRAAARSQVVVFCGIDGKFDAVRLKAAARRIKGVDAASLRTSSEPAALSFALDAARQSPEAALAELQHALPAGARLSIVRLMNGSAPTTAAR